MTRSQENLLLEAIRRLARTWVSESREKETRDLDEAENVDTETDRMLCTMKLSFKTSWKMTIEKSNGESLLIFMLSYIETLKFK